MITLWQRYQKYLCACDNGLVLDVSRMRFTDVYCSGMRQRIKRALAKVADLEAGAIANADEKRMVGHYWLRDADKAPNRQLSDAIRSMQQNVDDFAKKVLDGRISAPNGKPFKQFLLIGIGGSALGPQWIDDALYQPSKGGLKAHFFDNTDPEGMARVLENIGKELKHTLVIVTSKSGSTAETQNGLAFARLAFKKAKLDIVKHLVAVTGVGSKLDKLASDEGWLARFEMWDWVGGRTSEMSAVGLLPAALSAIDIHAMLAGARDMDAAARKTELTANPSAMMAMMWHYATDGVGAKDLVILPYKDRLALTTRYMQQLIMESLGKQYDRDVQHVEQGLTVYGNKGSTDQHALVQQLREGVNNFFATFIVVEEPGAEDIEIDGGAKTNDYLHAFYLGTRRALYDNGRDSMTIHLPRVDAYYIGALIALFERSVSIYAELINVNAYHQPGVEAGKKAASSILALRAEIMRCLRESKKPMTARQIAEALDDTEEIEIVHQLLAYAVAAKEVVASSDCLSDYERTFKLL